METTKITVESVVNADKRNVWVYYTLPKHIVKWNFADPSWHCPSATNDLRVGGKFSARMEAKDGSYGFDFNTLYDEVVKHEKIAYTMEDGRKAVITFSDDDDTTRVTVTFDAESENDVEMQKTGWQAILDSFKKYAEQMQVPLLYDFSVLKEQNSIVIKREFAAPLPLVWKAFTNARLLNHWWGPKPWRAETKTMDFREGGHWLYAMVGPEGSRHWSKSDYLSIVKESSFTARDGFCDEHGTADLSMPQNLWETRMEETDHATLVTIRLTFDKPEDLDQIMSMGFKEGISMGLDQLQEFLANLDQ